MWFHLRVLLITFWLSFLCNALKTKSSDIAVLEEFYTSTGGQNWDYDSMKETLNLYNGSFLLGNHWNFTKDIKNAYIADPCESKFQGINCTCNSSVCDINWLAPINGNLIGSLPPVIGKLTSLTHLYLPFNKLTSTIPSSIGELKSLHLLYLNSNQFSGAIDMIGELKSLEFLLLNNNQFSGGIDMIGELKSLHVLGLNNNQFSGGIDRIGELKSLHLLYLNSNQFSGGIDRIGELKSLEFLHLNNNQFSGTIPSGFQHLKQLWAGNNKLTGPLPDIHSNDLHILSVHDNQFSGHLLINTNATKLLEVLQVHNNKFSGNPFSSIINAKVLKVLDISTNSFTGVVPDTLFSQLSKLNTFVIGSNCFTGTISEKICDVLSLRTLVLTGMGSGPTCTERFWENTPFDNIFNGFRSKHYIEGTLPECLFNMPSLNQLYAGGNRVVGKFPTTVIDSLKNISLSYNNIYGELPSSLGKNGDITLLDLSNNRLSGDISTFKNSNSKNLDLSLRVNNLSGDIPIALRSLKNIDILAGNVFGCSRDRDTIPNQDPSVDSYECGSGTIDQYMYFFAVVFFLMSLVVFYIFNKDRTVINEFKYWMEVVDERRRICDADSIQIKSISKYNYQLLNCMGL
jgi:Leucine-rich repeat (LRR) protein